MKILSFDPISFPKKKFFISIIFVLCYFFLLISRVWATGYTITQLTDNNYYDKYPQIHNGQVVWYGYDGNDYEIFLYDGTQIIQLTDNDYQDYAPQIHNGQVVWYGYDGDDGEIFLYDRNRTTQLTDNSYNDYTPQIHNGQVVWYGDDEIFLYDGTQTIQLTDNNYYDRYPQIHNGQVVWRGGSSLTHLQIFLYDGTQTIQLTDTPYWTYSAQIHNGQVVWDSFDGMSSKIFLYTGNRIIQLTDNYYTDWHPQIHNGQVVWIKRPGHYFNSREILFYDGTRTVQLTDDNYMDDNPRIHNGQIAWVRWSDWLDPDTEILLYDGTSTIQLADSGYHDLFSVNIVDIHNGQVVWYGYDGNDLEIFLASSGLTLEILDGVDFSAGKEISVDPERLVSGGIPAVGAVTDGVARLLLRLKLNESRGVTFSLEGEGATGDSDRDGVLRSIDGTQEGQSITVSTVNVNDEEYAFAIYQVPDNFVRQGYDEDKVVSERTITLNVEYGSSSPLEKEIKLVRPPVILIHGLWSGPDMWDDFIDMLKSELSGIYIFTADYEKTNASYFSVNIEKEVVKKKIEKAKENLRADGIAMIQADVVGHSMGGLLARIYAGGDKWSGQGQYKYDKNFQMGGINKLITLDSPHYGSFLADATLDFIDSLDPVAKEFLLRRARNGGRPLDEGMLQDLNTWSFSLLYMDGIPTDPASHTLVGDYVVNVDLSKVPGDIGEIYTMLKKYGFNTNFDIIPGESDLVVSATSQAGGLTGSGTSTFYHHHLAATHQDVVDKTIELLNDNSDSSLFEEGFPVLSAPQWRW